MNIPIYFIFNYDDVEEKKKKKKNKIKSFNLFTTNKRNPTNRNSISHNLNYYIIEILSLFFRCRRRSSFRLTFTIRYFFPFQRQTTRKQFQIEMITFEYSFFSLWIWIWILQTWKFLVFLFLSFKLSFNRNNFFLLYC